MSSTLLTRNGAGATSGIRYTTSLAAPRMHAPCIVVSILAASILALPTSLAALSPTRAAPIEDQQLAGIIMWGPMSLVYAAAIIICFAPWLDGVERETRCCEWAAHGVAKELGP